MSIVALHRSAWIEIIYKNVVTDERSVALHRSAWIEITNAVCLVFPQFCRTPQECVD